MATAQKTINSFPNDYTTATAPSSDSPPLSQADAFILVATILARLNFINSKNRLSLIQNQANMDTSMQKLSMAANDKNLKKIEDYEAKLEAQSHLSWWQKLLSYFNPLTWITELTKAIFHIDLQKIIAERMQESFKHMSAAERETLKGVILFASVMPGLCLLAMAMNSSGLLSYQTLLAAGEDKDSTFGKIANYVGMAIDMAGKIATAIAISVAISAATGGAGIPAAVAELVGETAAAIASVTANIFSAVQIGASLGGAGLGIASGVGQLETADLLKALALTKSFQQLMTMLIEFTQSSSQEVLDRTKTFINQINSDIKGLAQLLAPYRALNRI